LTILQINVISLLNKKLDIKTIILTINQMRGARIMEKKEYQKPSIVTYSEEEILEIMGPAQTIASSMGQ